MIVNRFITVLADQQTARDIHFELRFKIFCEETGFEDENLYPDRRERDEFDSRATHFIVWDRFEKQWVGAMRLVGGSEAPFPCESICHTKPYQLESLRHKSREFSRLCILSKYRQTPDAVRFGMVSPEGDTEGPPIPAFFRQEDHEILLRLLRASFAWGKENGVDHCYFIVNAALARVLTRFGIPLVVAGPPVQHRGPRTPHRYNIQEAEVGMIATLPSFGRLVRNSPAYVPYTQFIHGYTKTASPRSIELRHLWHLGTPTNSLVAVLH